MNLVRPTTRAAALALSGVFALGTVAAATTAPALASAPAAAAAPSAQDTAWLQDAARANLAEVAMGQLAKKEARSVGVREFGREMVRDHRKQYRALEATATAVGATLPSRPSKEQRKIVKLWSTLEGKAFDCAYVPFQWGDHQLVIAKTQTEVALGTDPTVKAAAAASLPVLEEHYMHVTKLLNRLRGC